MKFVVTVNMKKYIIYAALQIEQLVQAWLTSSLKAVIAIYYVCKHKIMALIQSEESYSYYVCKHMALILLL